MTEKPYVVRIWNNFHYMDEDEAYDHGSFATYEEALAAAMAIVDQSLEECVPTTGSAEDLYKRYVMFGDDPGILGPPRPPGMPSFSAWDYAKARSGEIFGMHANDAEPSKSPEAHQLAKTDTLVQEAHTNEAPASESEEVSGLILPSRTEDADAQFDRAERYRTGDGWTASSSMAG